MWAVVHNEPAAPSSGSIEFRQTHDFVTFTRWFARFAVAFSAAWCVFVVAAGAWFWAPIGVGIGVGITAMCRRFDRLAVVAAGDELVITNMTRTRRLERREIERFRGGRRHLHVDVRNRMMPEVCDLFSVFAVGARDDAKECADRLNAWLV